MADFIKQNDDRISSVGNKVQSNITDPENAKLKSNNGILQGYNGIAAVDSKHQVIVNAEVFGEINERVSVEPMLDGIESNLNDSFKYGRLSETKFTADTGFNSEEVLKFLNERGVFRILISGNVIQSLRDGKDMTVLLTKFVQPIKKTI